MTERASDDAPRLILQQLANGKLMREAIYRVSQELGQNMYTVHSLFTARKKRSGYSTTYEMLASYVAEGLVLVDKKPAF